jgi:hypothetical protein
MRYNQRESAASKMKIGTITMVVLICACGTLGFGQSDKPGFDNFRIDSTKPYVYLQLLSIGPRKPLDPSEPEMGIRLRLVNNSHLPISIITLASNDEQTKSGYSVVDEVIPDTWIGLGDGPGGGATGVRADQETLTDITRWPNQTEQEIRGAEAATQEAQRGKISSQLSSRPYGYNDQPFLGLRQLTIILPGDAVSFSYPANHISERWHLEVPFRSALPSSGNLRPPYSYVALFSDDLSESDRSKLRSVTLNRNLP